MPSDPVPRLELPAPVAEGPLRSSTVDELADVMRGRRTLVLTGAGISTDSGIPDYRGDGRSARTSVPITHREFMDDPEARRRYWARSQAGYRHVGTVDPNDGHRSVTALQQAGLVAGVVTQNVDRLHQQAGTVDVVDLHGRIDRVICTNCGTRSPRDELAERLAEANPQYDALLDVVSTPFQPDGDADVAAQLFETFTVVDCLVCGGLLKPDVVFFGESMPRERRDHASALLRDADGILVLGSSLAVMSGYRLVLQADRAGQAVSILTRGPSRADHLADVRIDAPLTPTLHALIDAIGA